MSNDVYAVTEYQLPEGHEARATAVEYNLTASQVAKNVEADAKRAGKGEAVKYPHLKNAADVADEDGNVPFAGDYDFGEVYGPDGKINYTESIQRARAVFGDRRVFSFFRQGSGLGVGSNVRIFIRNGVRDVDAEGNPTGELRFPTREEIQLHLNEFLPSSQEKKAKLSPEEQLRQEMAGLTPEQKAAKKAAILAMFDDE
jgi:hypothetical protein